MADATALLEVNDIETCYGLSQVLFGLSISVRTGEMVAMMGRNGMGKTTTIRSIMGLTPARSGAIRFAELRGARPIRVIKLADTDDGTCRRQKVARIVTDFPSCTSCEDA